MVRKAVAIVSVRRARPGGAWLVRRVLAGVCLALTVIATPAQASAAPPPGPGQLIAMRPLPPSQTLPSASRSLLLEYSSNDATGRTRSSSAALYLPHVRARTVVSWAHGANGLGDQCAPTALGRPAREYAYFQRLLESGFAVVATDYIGLGTPGPAAFLDSVGEADAVTDAASAAHRVEPSISSWIADGHSQGAHATFNAAAGGPARAPELRYLGAAATSFPPQVDALVPAVTTSTPSLPIDVSWLYLMALRGFADTRPDLDIQRHLSPLGRHLFDTIGSECVDRIAERTKGVVPAGLLGSDLTDPEVRAFQDYLRLPTGGISRPMFLGHGLRDETLPIPIVLPVVAQLRTNGTDVRFAVFDAGHDDIIDASSDQRVAFLKELAG